jgi:tetratricopeptide (TPR) repeat protein
MSDKLKAAFYCASPIAYHVALPLKISAGQSFELMLPVWFAFTALLSSWVLASARRRRFSVAAVTLWTMGTLFFPLIILPIYLIARSSRHRREKEPESREAVPDSENHPQRERQPGILLRRTLPLLYLLVVLSLGGLYFYMDRRSADAHLMRANQARVREQREQVIEEYRAALKVEDDAHTHNLLGKEFQAARRFDEALREFRIAERMGEADEELPLNLGLTLEGLNRPAEAKPEYERFLKGPLCVEMPYDWRCRAARVRLTEIAALPAR